MAITTKKSRIIKNILLGLLGVLVVIQFFRIDKTNPPVEPGQDFLNLAAPPAELGTLIRNACYDCHSNETKYPWYTNVQPVAWWVKDHIDEGREELNFSEWGTYNAKKRAHKMEEAVEETKEGEMPLSSYTWVHANSRLSDAQRQELAAWFQEQMTKEGAGQSLSEEEHDEHEGNEEHEEHEEHEDENN